MIAYLYGQLLEKLDTSVVVDTGGVGYEVFVPSNSQIWLKGKGDDVVLHTAQIFKEDDVSLYGFENRESLRLFRLLITVSGVGAKAAMAVLSALTVDETVRAIAFEDAAMITRAQGVGKKSAERIILELKDKVTELFSGFGDAFSGIPPASATGAASLPAGGPGDIAAEAISVLMGLGISRSEASRAVMNIKDEYDSVESCIRLALKGL